ncbi:MAG: hypothetical protein HGB19_13630, partial [Chlorobiales bacterium]|nr:hypothetical protein [Chlorobiales bacterium]
PSMQYSDQQGHDQWKQAKLAALKVLDNLGNEDEVFLSFLRPGENFSQPLTPTEARRKITDAEISFSAVPTEDRLREGLGMLARSKNFNREVYTISDFHASGFLSPDTAITADKNFANIKTYFIDVGIPDKQNVGILESEVVSKIFEPDKPVQVRATYRISGLTNQEGLIAELRFNDKLAKENALSADTASVVNTTFSATPRDKGFISCTVSLPDDNFATDNKHYSAFYIPEHLRLLLVYNNPEDILFLKHALESYENNQYFEVQISPEQRLDERDFSQFDAVLLAGIQSLSSASEQKIAHFIHQGGGLLFFASPNLENYSPHNQLLKTIGGGKLGPELSEVKGSPRSIDRIDYRHPIFDGVFVRSATAAYSGSSERQTSRDFPKILNAASYQKSGNETVLASFGGAPLATTLSYGAGKCVVFSTVPSLQTTTLVFDPIFVPLCFRSVFWATAKTEVSARSFTVGIADEIALPQTTLSSEKLVVKKPDGKTFIPELRQHSGGNQLLLKPEVFDLPGIYDVVRERNESGKTISDRVTLLAFNISPAESDSKKIPFEALKKTAERTGINTSNIFYAEAITSVEAVTTAISGSRFGFGVWKYLVGLAAICLVAESILGRKTVA